MVVRFVVEEKRYGVGLHCGNMWDQNSPGPLDPIIHVELKSSTWSTGTVKIAGAD